MTDQTFRVISQPNLNFTVILNPDSGPGSSRYPGDDFVPQIQKLNSYSNVRTVGYVRTGYGTRNISSVLIDVSTYSGWATNASANANSTGLALHGIFFDEIPSKFSEEADKYLNTINQAVKISSGLLPDNTVSKLISVSLYLETSVIRKVVRTCYISTLPPPGRQPRHPPNPILKESI
jgi:hypothetical protein